MIVLENYMNKQIFISKFVPNPTSHLTVNTLHTEPRCISPPGWSSPRCYHPYSDACWGKHQTTELASQLQEQDVRSENERRMNAAKFKEDLKENVLHRARDLKLGQWFSGTIPQKCRSGFGTDSDPLWVATSPDWAQYCKWIGLKIQLISPGKFPLFKNTFKYANEAPSEVSVIEKTYFMGKTLKI